MRVRCLSNKTKIVFNFGLQNVNSSPRNSFEKACKVPAYVFVVARYPIKSFLFFEHEQDFFLLRP